MSEQSTIRFNAPAKVLKRAPTADLLNLAKEQHANDETVFDELKPFFWSAEISNNSLDTYFTKMSRSTLENYANDAKAGVSFQDSHNNRRLPMGRSLTGTLIEDGETIRVVADFFTIRGLKFNDATYQSSDDFINSVRSGIASDVSVGFYGGQHICSVCKLDMYDWEQGCRHWEGDEVEIKDEQTGETVRKEIVFAWVTNAHLSEVSAVYDGSTDGAKILKAQRAIEEGQLTPEHLRRLEDRYRIKLPDTRVIVTVGNSTQEASIMSVEKPTEPTATERSNQDSSLLETQTRQLAEVISEAPKDKPIVEQVRFLNDEVKRLRPLADMGTQYRDDLVNEAIAEGVRAVEGFTEESYRGMLTNAPIETIKRMRDDWKAIGDKQFTGGRKTKDEVDPPAETAPKTARIMDKAYQA